MALVAAVGCRSTGPSGVARVDAGIASYRAGEASQAFNYPADEVAAATEGALDDLAFRAVHREAAGAGQSTIVAQAPDGRRARLAVAGTGAVTRVGARVGTFGDQALSLALLDRVGVRLGARPPEAIPAEAPSTPDGNPYFSREGVSDREMLRDQADAGYRDSPIAP